MRLLLPFLLLISACSPVATASQQDRGTSDSPIALTISLYVVESSDGPGSPSSSQRTPAELEGIFSRMETIWDQANVDLELASSATITAPEAVLFDLASGDTNSFFNAASAGVIVIPEPGAILGFYVKQIGSANGLTPLGTRIFFVADDPSVNDERVSSHEVGHILGLNHTRDDASRLMYSGTNGTGLTDEEAVVARYGATAILDGVR
jgi:hypothetical protein